jgi:hypothetical protein
MHTGHISRVAEKFVPHTAQLRLASIFIGLIAPPPVTTQSSAEWFEIGERFQMNPHSRLNLSGVFGFWQ